MKEKEIKQRLLDEISGWFCESYCLYYGNKDYCDTCPIKEEKYWLVRPKPTGAEKRIKEIQFCDRGDLRTFLPYRRRRGKQTKRGTMQG